MTTTEQQLSKKAKNELATYQPDMGLLDDAPSISKDHLRFSKIKIHQGTTSGRDGTLGELFTTPDGLKLCALGEKVIFYPITYKLVWYHNKKTPQDQKPVPMGVTEWTNANQFRFKEEKDGAIFQNFQTAVFFGLLERDLEKGVMTPIQIVLSSTSFSSAALPLMNRFDELKRFKIEPWLSKFALLSEKSKKGAWYVFKVEPVADKTGQMKADEKHWQTLRLWTKTIQTLNKSGALAAEVNEVGADVEESEKPASQPLNEEQLMY